MVQATFNTGTKKIQKHLGGSIVILTGKDGDILGTVLAVFPSAGESGTALNFHSRSEWRYPASVSRNISFLAKMTNSAIQGLSDEESAQH